MSACPRFETACRTHISVKHGISDPDRLTESTDRPKVIDVPVLKPHSIYGVTGWVKHYMGSRQTCWRVPPARAHNPVGTVGMGTKIAETRFAASNILDAIWVSLTPGVGPQAAYEQATQVDVIAASTDPVALDYWGAKPILDEIAAAGHLVNTVDAARMNVCMRPLAGP